LFFFRVVVVHVVPTHFAAGKHVVLATVNDVWVDTQCRMFGAALRH
jgi:hypothetical protein